MAKDLDDRWYFNVETGKAYILGPRGGCFFVTASGSKKYVDRSLCSQTTAAAGRVPSVLPPVATECRRPTCVAF